ncbi:MAG: hypothetical protein ACOVKC_08420, partial [Brevundimonas sp.]
SGDQVALAGVDGTPGLIPRLAGTIKLQHPLIQGAQSSMRCGGEQVRMIPTNNGTTFSTGVENRR